MTYDLKDLREVMEARSADRLPAPDLLANVQRRIRRSTRLRLAAGAVGTVIAVGAIFTATQLPGPRGPEKPGRPLQSVQPMLGAANEAFPKSSPREGMRPLLERQFSMTGKAPVTFTPTGPNTMITYRCSVPSTLYEMENGLLLSSGGCDENGGAESYLPTTRGASRTREFAALPLERSDAIRTVADLDRYLAAHQPEPRSWSVQIYSGRCTMTTCNPPVHQPPQPSVQGLHRLVRTAHAADGHSRTISFTPSGTSVRLRVTCLDGAAVAVVKSGGRAKVIECERAEFDGVVWDQATRPGTRSTLKIIVLPAAAPKVTATSDAALAKLIRGVAPLGKWTLDVYDR
ncbi:MAG TPA: hypothetical protein VH912_02245 [Streptosporangiaceae bacterium]|jgi:hypothetical protein